MTINLNDYLLARKRVNEFAERIDIPDSALDCLIYLGNKIVIGEEHKERLCVPKTELFSELPSQPGTILCHLRKLRQNGLIYETLNYHNSSEHMAGLTVEGAKLYKSLAGIGEANKPSNR